MDTPKLTIRLQLGAMFFPVMEIDLAKLMERHKATSNQVILECVGQISQLNVALPAGEKLGASDPAPAEPNQEAA